MVRRRNKWCAGILVFVIFVTGIFPVTVNAMTEKKYSGACGAFETFTGRGQR